jgi:hypothetical protein
MNAHIGWRRREFGKQKLFDFLECFISESLNCFRLFEKGLRMRETWRTLLRDRKVFRKIYAATQVFPGFRH